MPVKSTRRTDEPRRPWPPTGVIFDENRRARILTHQENVNAIFRFVILEKNGGLLVDGEIGKTVSLQIFDGGDFPVAEIRKTKNGEIEIQVNSEKGWRGENLKS